MAVLSKPLPYRPTKRRSTARNYSDDLSNSASAAGKPVLKALLIATAGNNKNPKGPRTLLTPHRDARAWRDTLISELFSAFVKAFASRVLSVASGSHA